MALVVESTSFAVTDNSASVTVTKPTGVQAGDLLLIISYGTATCSGFSTAISGTGSDVLYKIADSGDVSASDYSVSHGGATNSGIAAMMRISGWVAGNPIYFDDEGTASADDTDPVVFSRAVTVPRPSTNTIMLIIGQIGSVSLSNTGQGWASYTVTSGESNPSWTEIVDAWCETGGGTSDNILAVAYATTANSSNITNWGVTADGSGLGPLDFYRALFVTISAPQDASGTHTLLQPNPSFFAVASRADTNGTSTLLEVSPTINAQSGRGTSPTQWSNETKPTTTWQNETP